MNTNYKRKYNNIAGRNFFVDQMGCLVPIQDDETVEDFSEKHCILLNINFSKIYRQIQILKPFYNDLELSYKDLLIDILGYVLYSYNDNHLNIEAPDYNINNREVTNEQRIAIKKLLEINSESEFLMYGLTNGESRHYKYNKTLILTK